LTNKLLVVGVAVAALAVGWYARALLYATSDPIAAPSLARHTPYAPRPAVDSKQTKQAFEGVYKTALWGASADPSSGVAGSSGIGSRLETTVYWRAFLDAFLKANHIASVVDAGCGDWEFSHTMDWTGIDYKGYDIVDAVIQGDKKYEAANIHFFTADIIETELPAADLLISKNVLQHLPNAAVAKLIPQFAKYKHVLIVNGVDPVTLSPDNPDIKPGEYRELDITAPPFSVPGARVLTYWDGHHMHQVVHVRGHE
jgi:SAM-dependent methyltransferase